MKSCTKCNQTKSKDQFRVANKRTGRLSAYCKECQRNVSRAHYAANTESHKKRVIINSVQRAKTNREKYKALKGELKCNRCSETHIAVLDFHHEDPSTKDRAISNMIYSWSFEVVLKEMEKCEVLCSNCHRKHHYEEKAGRSTTHK